MLTAGAVPVKSFACELSSNTIGVLTENFCVLEFHSLTPNTVDAVSTQYVPLTGAPIGSVLVGVNAARSISARTMYARELTPNALYAACRPYSFNSLPCNGLPLLSV